MHCFCGHTEASHTARFRKRPTCWACHLEFGQDLPDHDSIDPYHRFEAAD